MFDSHHKAMLCKFQKKKKKGILYPERGDAAGVECRADSSVVQMPTYRLGWPQLSHGLHKPFKNCMWRIRRLQRARISLREKLLQAALEQNGLWLETDDPPS